MSDGAPLRTALGFGYKATARTLARRGAAADALDLAAGLGDIESRPEDGGTGLHEAILWNRRQVVSRLLERGADPQVRHGKWQATALELASYNGRLQRVEILLAHGEHDLEAPLVSAAGQGHVEVARRLLAAGADPTRGLERAREVGNDAMVALLQETA